MRSGIEFKRFSFWFQFHSALFMHLKQSHALPIRHVTCTAPRVSSVVTACNQTPVITIPLFYLNAKPHIGHLYSAVLGDAFARWHLMQKLSEPFESDSMTNSDTYPHELSSYLIVGSDEHGSKVMKSSKDTGISVSQHCNILSNQFLEMYKLAHVSYSVNLRTTHPHHASTVQNVWKQLALKDYIYKGEYKVFTLHFLIILRLRI